MPAQNEAELNAIETRINSLLDARTRHLQELVELDVSFQDAQTEYNHLSGRPEATAAIPVESLIAIHDEIRRPSPPDPPMEIIIAQILRAWRNTYKYPPRLWAKIIDDVQGRAREEFRRRNWDTKSSSSRRV